MGKPSTSPRAERSRIRPAGKVFRDPVHRLIRIAPDDEFILDLIDTPELQRLRRIRQLGVSWLTYHGAEHSRFTHSLGVFSFAQRIIDSLRSRYGEKDPVTKVLTKHERAIKAAALVHDVGHAPFSHMLERAFDTKTHHEDRTIQLILSPSSRINSILNRHQIDPADVASIIRKDFPEKLAVDVVSSQLDADRMDYLLRDSYCTGVGYGEYDPDWLFHAMCVGRVKGDAKREHLKLCLDRRRGLYAAERFVIARLHMYQQVYMHRVTRGFEVLTLNLFMAGAYCARNGGLPSSTPDLVKKYFKAEGKLDLDDILRFDESQVIAAFHNWAEASGRGYATIRRLSNAFLNRERLYGSVDLAIGTDGAMKLFHGLEALKKEKDGETPLFKVDTFEDTPYKGMVYRARGQNATAEEMINESILLADPAVPDSAAPVESLSRMLKNLDAEVFEIKRLYFDRASRAAIQPLANELKIKLPATEA